MTTNEIEWPVCKTKASVVDALKAIREDMMDYLIPSSDRSVNDAVDDLRKITHDLEE